MWINFKYRVFKALMCSVLHGGGWCRISEELLSCHSFPIWSHFLLFFLCLSIHHFLYIPFSILFYFYLLSTIFSPSSPICAVVEVPALSDDDISVIFEDELDAPPDISLSETVGREILLVLMNLSQYYCEYIYLKLVQRVDPVYSQRQISERVSKYLAKSTKTQANHYILGLMGALFRAKLNSNTSPV